MSATAKPYEKDSARLAEQVPGVRRKIDRHPGRNGASGGQRLPKLGPVALGPVNSAIMRASFYH
jgi:hypothetical protein